MDYKVGELGQFRIIDKENRIIGGYMGDDNVDTDGHWIPKDAYMEAIQEYLKWGNIRDAHKNAAGIVTSYGTKGWNYIEVKVVDDNAWKMVESGVYKGFSIGAKVYQKTKVPLDTVPQERWMGLPTMVKKALQKINQVLRIDSMLLAEISLTDRPVNQAALFAKSESGESIEVLESLTKDMITTSTSTALAPMGAAMRKKKMKKRMMKKEITMNEDTQVTEAAQVESEQAETPVVEETEKSVVPVEAEVSEDVEKAIQADPTTNAVPPKNGADNQEQPAADPMDTVKGYIDTSLMNMYNAIVEQMNISINMLGEKITAQTTAFMNQMMQAMCEDDAQEDAAEPADNTVMNQSEGTELKSVTESETPAVVAVESTPTLTADMVKAMVKEAIAEALPVVNAPVERKGVINKGEADVQTEEQPLAKPLSKAEQLRQVALKMAQSSIRG